MRKVFLTATALLGVATLWSCDPLDENGVPENLSVTLSETPIGHGDVVSVSDYSFDFNVEYRKDLIVTFEALGATASYEDQMVEGSRKEQTEISLEAQSHLTLVTLSRAKNGETVFQFTVSGPFNQEEAEESIDDISTEFTKDIVAMLQSEGISALQQLSDLMFPAEGTGEKLDLRNRQKLREQGIPSKQVIRGKAAELRKLFDLRANQSFQSKVQENGLTELAGRYEWNADSGEFYLTDETLDILEVLFPIDGSTTNNAALRLTEYYYAGETTDGTDDLIRLQADLTVDGDLVMDANARVYEGESAAGYDLGFFLDPFDYTSVAGYDLNAMTAEASQSLAIDGDILMASSLEADLTTDEFGDPWPTEIRGSQQVHDLKLEATVDVATAETWDESTNPDTFVTASMSAGGTEMGDIVWVNETDETEGYTYWYPYLELPNGDLVDVVTLMEQEIQEIEDIIITTLEGMNL